MLKLNVLLLAGLSCGATAVLGACNSGQSVEPAEPTEESHGAAPTPPTWGEVCAHLGELLHAEVTDSMCEVLQNDVLGRCDDVVAQMRCILDATDMDAYEDCYELCPHE